MAPGAAVVGGVEIGPRASIWYHCAIRGDINKIIIGADTNIQDGTVIHVADDHPAIVGDRVSVGHRAIIHACEIGDETLIGMGAIIMDGAVIGEDSVVGAGALVVEGTMVPPKSLILGSPAKVKRPVTEKELAWIRESAGNYVRYARQYMGDPAKKTGFEI